ncbi:MAG TPA: serine protease, partial [Pseudonocardiaceae bacterium]|nr:serine protease [Pseudonocardiaceae bacterium]
MTARLVASGFMLLVLAGCGWSRGQDSTPGPPALQAASQLPPAKEAAKSVSRSLWGVVPAAPKRKQDLRPELIKGSAVAVADDALLTSCSVLGNRKQVGLIRHNKYRMAKLVSADPRGEVCVLRVPDGPLNVAAGYRDPADLRLGEPVYALMNQTSSDVALVQGELTGLAAQEGGPRLETSLVLPADVQSGVLIDGYGNLVGVAAPRPGTAGGVTMTAVPGRLAPQLASLDAPSSTVPLPVAAPRAVPVAATSPPPVLVLQLDDDRDTDRQSIGVARAAPAAPATEMAGTSTTVDQEDTTSTVSRSEGRTSASRSDNGGRSGRGAGGSTASGATGDTSTDTSDTVTDGSAARSSGTGNAGANTGSIGSSGTGSGTAGAGVD